MEQQKQAQPRITSIFELINQNIVDLSQDVVKLYQMVAEIHTALYPPTSEPNADGAETINE